MVTATTTTETTVEIKMKAEAEQPPKGPVTLESIRALKSQSDALKEERETLRVKVNDARGEGDSAEMAQRDETDWEEWLKWEGQQGASKAKMRVLANQLANLDGRQRAVAAQFAQESLEYCDKAASIVIAERQALEAEMEALKPRVEEALQREAMFTGMGGRNRQLLNNATVNGVAGEQCTESLEEIFPYVEAISRYITTEKGAK